MQIKQILSSYLFKFVFGCAGILVEKEGLNFGKLL
jgi:hypothetical protein